MARDGQRRHRLAAPIGTRDQHVRDQLSAFSRSATFQQADRLKRFLTFIVNEAIAGRQPSSRNTSSACRCSARKTPSIRARIRSSACRRGACAPSSSLLPRGGADRRVDRSSCRRAATRRSSSVARRRCSSGDRSPRRSSAATRSPWFPSPTTARRAISTTSARAFATKSCIISRDFRTSGSSRRSAAETERRARDQRQRAAVGRSAAHRCAAHRQRHRLLPVVRIGRRPISTMPFGAQEQVAERIVKKLEAEIGDRGQSASAARRPTENLAAQNLYLQGRYHLNQRTEEGLRKAVDFFEKALVEDGAVRARAQRAGRCLRPARPLRRARAGRRVDEGRVQRGAGGDARRSLRRGAHVARARAGRRRTGTGPAPNASSSAPSAANPRYATGASLVRDVVPGAARPARRSAATR